MATWFKELTHLKRPWCWERLKVGEKGTTEDEMGGWHHWLSGHEFEQALGVGDGQGGLACCSPWGHKESDTTERLNWTELNWSNYTSTVGYIFFSLNCLYVFVETQLITFGGCILIHCIPFHWSICLYWYQYHTSQFLELSSLCCVLCWVTQPCLTIGSPGSSVCGDSPGKNTGVDCHALLQGIFPTQGLNPGLPHCRRILYHLNHHGSPAL